MGNSAIRMGVDIGGTFTDVVIEVESKQFSTKVLTTYIAPENAIIDGLHRSVPRRVWPRLTSARSSTAPPLPPTL